MVDYADLFRVLGDETRLRILLLLYRERLCVCQLCGVLGLSQPMVSKGLSKLRDLGLVSDERRDRFVFYSLREDVSLLRGVLGLVVAGVEEGSLYAEDEKRLVMKDDLLDGCVVPSFVG